MVVLTKEAQLIELGMQRDVLRRAIRSGALKVEHGDKRVTYRSMADLQSALADIELEINTLIGGRRSRFRYHTTSKGLG